MTLPRLIANPDGCRRFLFTLGSFQPSYPLLVAFLHFALSRHYRHRAYSFNLYVQAFTLPRTRFEADRKAGIVPGTMKNLIQQGLAIRELARDRIVIIDGAMGTMLQQQNLTAADFGGPEWEGCFENLVVTRPEIILGIHRAYLAAGAHITKTDSFGGAPLVLK